MKFVPGWENCIRHLNKEVAHRTQNQGRRSLIPCKITMNYIVSISKVLSNIESIGEKQFTRFRPAPDLIYIYILK